MTEEVILLSSGGLDSTTLAYWLQQQGRSVAPIFFDYGQHCVETEWSLLKEILPTEGFRPPRRIDITDIFRGSTSRLIVEPNLWTEQVQAADLYIPYRTLLFLSAGAAIAQTLGLSEVFAGFINSNHAKEIDCSAAFLNNLGELAEGIGPVRFGLPFRDKSKREVAEIAKTLGVPIGRTFSCQVFSDVPCGVCPNCVDRLSALREAGLDR